MFNLPYGCGLKEFNGASIYDNEVTISLKNGDIYKAYILMIESIDDTWDFDIRVLKIKNKNRWKVVNFKELNDDTQWEINDLIQEDIDND